MPTKTIRTGLRIWNLSCCFWRDEQGQDLTEYGLLLAFVVLAATGIFLVNAQSIHGIWVATNDVINQAASRSLGS